MNIQKPRRLAIAGVAGVALAIAGVVSVGTADSQETDQIGHFWSCVASMITAPDQHEAECLSGGAGPGLTSLSTPVSAGGPAPIAPEPTGPLPTQGPPPPT